MNPLWYAPPSAPNTTHPSFFFHSSLFADPLCLPPVPSSDSSFDSHSVSRLYIIIAIIIITLIIIIIIIIILMILFKSRC